MKNISTLIRSLLLLMIITSSAMAQQRQGGNRPRQQEKRENIESMKVAFITQKLELTPEEAQKFWPVYNQYSESMKGVRKKRMQDNRDARQNFDALTDKEVEQIVDNELASRQKELDIQKEYNLKFKSVLPIKKVAKLYAAEEQFKRVLIDKLKDSPPIKE